MLLGALLFLPTNAIAAEQSLRVSPVIINVTLSPDKTYTHEVTVENLTDKPLPLRATFNDFLTADEEGGYVFEDTKTNPLLSWITLNETEFIINPNEKKTMQMIIKTPKSISLGGYYGILFFEPVVQNVANNGARVSSKVGVLMLANVGAPDKNAPAAEIVDVTTPLLDSDGDIPLVLRVKNISLNFFTAKPIVKVTPFINTHTFLPGIMADQDVKERTLEDKIIFPGKIRRWTEEHALQTLTPNIYKTDITVSTGNGQSVTKSSYIIVFPAAKALLILMIVIVLSIIITKRKRLRNVIKELVS